jgi:hypothetical protein
MKPKPPPDAGSRVCRHNVLIGGLGFLRRFTVDHTSGGHFDLL